MAQARFQIVTVDELPEFADRAARDIANFESLPITSQRAEAQSRNPAAAPGDMALVVGYVGDRCRGYLGMIPCVLAHDTSRSKVFALSTFLVNPDARHLRLAHGIMETAISSNSDFLLSGFTPSAERFYSRHPEWFIRAPDTRYLHLHLDRLPRLIGPLLGAIDRVAGQGAHRLPARALRRFVKSLSPKVLARTSSGLAANVTGVPEQLRHQRVSVVRPLPESLPIVDPAKAHFELGTDWVNWMIQSPWIHNGGRPEPRYFFSSSRAAFGFQAEELFQEDTRVGQFTCSRSTERSSTVIKLIDYALVDMRFRPELLARLLEYSIEARANRLELPEEFLPAIESSSRLVQAVTEETRGNFVHRKASDSSIPEDLDEIQFRHCDGDIPFF